MGAASPIIDVLSACNGHEQRIEQLDMLYHHISNTYKPGEPRRDVPR